METRIVISRSNATRFNQRRATLINKPLKQKKKTKKKPISSLEKKNAETVTPIVIASGSDETKKNREKENRNKTRLDKKKKDNRNRKRAKIGRRYES